MIPADGCIGCCEGTEEVQNPGWRGATEPGADPVAFGVGGAAGAGLDQACTGKTGRENPDEVKGGLVLHVEQLEDHGTTHTERGETG